MKQTQVLFKLKKKQFMFVTSNIGLAILLDDSNVISLTKRMYQLRWKYCCTVNGRVTYFCSGRKRREI